LLVDDHSVVRAGIGQLLAGAMDIQVVGEMDSGEQAICFVQKQPVDLVLLDLQMPGISGFETARQLFKLQPNLKIIVLTAVEEGPLLHHLTRMGAQGYLTKNCPVEEMIRAIRKVQLGGTYFEASIREQLAESKQRVGSPFQLLSKREMEVVLMLAKKMSLIDIGASLGINSKTISTYRYRLLRKLGIKTNLELMLLGVKHKLFDTSLIKEEVID
jgi:Response regulator containing a CheY-like receiver domain and an HTH DNA-binding domain